MPGTVQSVNVGGVRGLVVANGDEVPSAIHKVPVDGRLRIADDHVAGDHQANPEAHGGPFQAAYAYAEEDTTWWSDELGRADLGPGTWGENLTLSGVEVTGAVVGARWRVGDAVLRVTGPRIPCFKLAARMGDPRFATRFARAGRPGAYLAIEQPGLVGPGDPVTMLDEPDHGVTVGEVAATYHRLGDPDPAARRTQLDRLLAVAEMPPSVRAWATDRRAHLA